ncbi:MAG: type II secretion system protein [Burkholderiales bacterium]|jgi:type II secretory pathway pseudopilin PulG|nr:type II secretion system protein [Burkholderiales bacterium]
MQHGDPAPAKGYTLVAVLVLLAIVALGLAAVGPIWSQEAQRERERELIRIGKTYASALSSYRAASPGSLKQFPASLEELLLDTRFFGAMHHMRKLYGDPVNPTKPWGLILDETGRIVGVHSLSEEMPLADRLGQTLVPVQASVRRYSELKFIAKSNS